jgi:RNA-directed DNA polymerase
MHRPPPDGHGRPACAIVDLVVPLDHESTAMRTTDTAANVLARSGAVSRPSNQPGDVTCTNDSTLTTRATPGIRTSTTATRTTTTPTTSSAPAPSADQPDFEALVRAYFDCRANKRNTASALAFEADLEANLVALHQQLTDGSYRIGPSICFVITRPKPREVWAAQFRDRIVHHLLYNHVGPRFERAFIADSCACIPGRGTLYAVRRLEAKIRSIMQSWSRPAFYLKLDLANFFVSIDKQVLAGLLARRIQEPYWRALTEAVLFHDPRPDAILQSPPAKMALIPPHKRLGNQSADRGLPIGNLSSQFFANVYLDVLDQFCKHRLRVKHYIRYVDDFVLLHESPQQLNAWRAEIEAFLTYALGLQLNQKKTILQPVERGIDFVGQVIKPHRTIVRRRTLATAMERTASAAPEDLLQTANSYFGLLRQATHSHTDRAGLANLLRRRRRAVDMRLTKSYA